MQLIDWMRANMLDDEAMTALVNEGVPPAEHCTVHAVKKWKYRERMPPADKIVRIEDITKKRVTLRDWTAPLRETARAS